jgi:hypothetical protein
MLYLGGMKLDELMKVLVLVACLPYRIQGPINTSLLEAFYQALSESFSCNIRVRGRERLLRQQHPALLKRGLQEDSG